MRGLLRAGTVAAKPGGLLSKKLPPPPPLLPLLPPLPWLPPLHLLQRLLNVGCCCEGVLNVGQGLLVESHAEFLDVRQFALHSGHGGCLGLH